MTAGYPSDAADDAVQANVVAAGYGGSSGVAPGSLTPGSAVSLQATTACCTDQSIRHRNGAAVISVIGGNSSGLDKQDATWVVRRGLAGGTCLSFESVNYPGEFLRHSYGRLYLQTADGSSLFHADATFCPHPGANGKGSSFSSSNYPGSYVRHYNGNVYIASDGGPDPWDSTSSWQDDVSWAVGPGWS